MSFLKFTEALRSVTPQIQEQAQIVKDKPLTGVEYRMKQFLLSLESVASSGVAQKALDAGELTDSILGTAQLAIALENALVESKEGLSATMQEMRNRFSEVVDILQPALREDVNYARSEMQPEVRAQIESTSEFPFGTDLLAILGDRILKLDQSFKRNSFSLVVAA